MCTEKTLNFRSSNRMSTLKSRRWTQCSSWNNVPNIKVSGCWSCDFFTLETWSSGVIMWLKISPVLTYCNDFTVKSLKVAWNGSPEAALMKFILFNDLSSWLSLSTRFINNKTFPYLCTFCLLLFVHLFYMSVLLFFSDWKCLLIFCFQGLVSNDSMFPCLFLLVSVCACVCS